MYKLYLFIHVEILSWNWNVLIGTDVNYNKVWKKDTREKENKWADRTKEREEKRNKNEKEVITKKRMNRKKWKHNPVR